MSELPTSLSPDGEDRRWQILGMALAEARVRRRRRVAARAIPVLLLLALLVWQLPRTKPPRIQTVVVKPVEAHSSVTARPAIVVTLIRTDPHIVERLAIPPQPLHVVVISDTELLNDLAMANRPAGLVYVNGKAMLLFR